MNELMYKAKTCGYFHNKGDVKSWKRWNYIYMIDVKERDRDFEVIHETHIEQ